MQAVVAMIHGIHGLEGWARGPPLARDAVTAPWLGAGQPHDGGPFKGGLGPCVDTQPPGGHPSSEAYSCQALRPSAERRGFEDPRTRSDLPQAGQGRPSDPDWVDRKDPASLPKYMPEAGEC
jgi:hypothetical protein